jgi:hypothetical protein
MYPPRAGLLCLGVRSRLGPVGVKGFTRARDYQKPLRDARMVDTEVARWVLGESLDARLFRLPCSYCCFEAARSRSPERSSPRMWNRCCFRTNSRSWLVSINARGFARRSGVLRRACSTAPPRRRQGLVVTPVTFCAGIATWCAGGGHRHSAGWAVHRRAAGDRPHRGLALQPPEPAHVKQPPAGDGRRRDRLGGLVHEYYRAAA